MTNNFDNVDKAFSDLQYMRVPQAVLLRDFIAEHDARDIIEIGFYHGKSSAYFAAILEDLGRGHLLTIDLVNAKEREPNIDQVLLTLGLRHRVTPVFAERSYTWELGKMIRTMPRPQFDLCYFDGGHTWDLTGFGFLLVDMLLRPGGWIVFDDLEWTMQSAMKLRRAPPRQWRACSTDEQATPGVKLVFDLLVPHLGYTDRSVVNGGHWGIARKPAFAARQQELRAPGFLKRLLGPLANR